MIYKSNIKIRSNWQTRLQAYFKYYQNEPHDEDTET